MERLRPSLRYGRRRASAVSLFGAAACEFAEKPQADEGWINGGFFVFGYIFFPADFLTWSEGDFVNDILKFSAGYSLYSPQIHDSFVYAPGSQLLTYLLAWLAGNGGSTRRSGSFS